MTDPEADLAPPPDERMLIVRAPVHGWTLQFDGETIAAFGTIGELTAWLDRVLGPADGERRADPLPAVLLTELEKPRPSMWSLIRGGKTE